MRAAQGLHLRCRKRRPGLRLEQMILPSIRPADPRDPGLKSRSPTCPTRIHQPNPCTSPRSSVRSRRRRPRFTTPARVKKWVFNPSTERTGRHIASASDSGRRATGRRPRLIETMVARERQPWEKADPVAPGQHVLKPVGDQQHQGTARFGAGRRPENSASIPAQWPRRFALSDDNQGREAVRQNVRKQIRVCESAQALRRFSIFLLRSPPRAVARTVRA